MSKKYTISFKEICNNRFRELFEGNIKSDFIQTGFSNIDKKISGFLMGELAVVAGRPCMGNTQLLISLALNISETHPVLFYSLDSAGSPLINRFISTVTKIPVNVLNNQKLTDNHRNELLEAYHEITQKKLFINDNCINLSTFKTQSKKLIEEKNIKVIIVDHIQSLIGKYHWKNPALEMNFVTKKLRQFAKDHKVCIIVSCRLGRNVEYKKGMRRPKLLDLIKTGIPLHYTDKIIFTYRPEYYGFYEDEFGNNLKGIFELIIAKNRHGSIGEVKLMRNEYFNCLQEYSE